MAEAAPSDCGQDKVTLLSGCLVNEYLDPASRHRRGDVTVAEMRVVNDTPLMLGGWGTLHYLPAGDGPEVVPTLLTAKPIVGKARWFLKRVIIYMGLARDLREAENTPRVKVALEDAGGGKPVEMGLVQLLFGSIKTGGGKTRGAWKGLYTIQVIHNPPEGRIEEIAFKEMVEERCSGSNRYFLIIMGKKSNIKELLLPLKPGAVSAQLLIRRRQGVRIYTMDGSSEKEIDPSLLDSLVVTVIIMVLRLLGIGKGATRGFGRFKITQLNTDINSPSFGRFSGTQAPLPLNEINFPDSGMQLESNVCDLLHKVYHIIEQVSSSNPIRRKLCGIYVKVVEASDCPCWPDSLTGCEALTFLLNRIGESVLKRSLRKYLLHGELGFIEILGLPRRRGRDSNKRMISHIVFAPFVNAHNAFIVIMLFRPLNKDLTRIAGRRRRSYSDRGRNNIDEHTHCFDQLCLECDYDLSNQSRPDSECEYILGACKLLCNGILRHLCH